MLRACVVPLLLGISCAVPSPQNNYFVPVQYNPLTGQINPVVGQPVSIGQPVLSPSGDRLNSVAGQVNPTYIQNNPATGPITPAISPNNPVNRPINPAIRPNNPVPRPVNTVPVPINPVTGQANPVAGQVNSVAGQVNPTTVQANPVAVQNNNAGSQVNNPSSNLVSNAKKHLGHLITDFGLAMSDEIHRSGEQDTVVFSPLSIATLMTLLMAGMGKPSQTYSETADALGYDPNGSDEEVIHQLYRSLLNDLSVQNDQVLFSMRNSLFLQGDDNNKLDILGSFTKTAKDNYNSGIETLNFFSDPFGAATHINEWVNTATKGKIPQLLTDPLSPQTKFMAVNTVYFKAPWLSPFSPDSTFVKSFDTGKRKIDMPFMIQIMSLKGHEEVSQNFNATIVELPYKGERYSMFIIKPKGPANLNSLLQLELALTPNNLNYIVETTKSKQPLPVSVQIPRMRLRYRAYLKEILENMGAKSMFSVTNADFSRMTSNSETIMDNMIHEAVMDITEEGTEAAAATSTTSNRFGTNLLFELNQPSLMFIYDSITKVPIFWVRLVTPESI